MVTRSGVQGQGDVYGRKYNYICRIERNDRSR